MEHRIVSTFEINNQEITTAFVSSGFLFRLVIAMANRYDRKYNGDEALELLFDDAFLETVRDTDKNILHSTMDIEVDANDINFEDDLSTIDINAFYSTRHSQYG